MDSGDCIVCGAFSAEFFLDVNGARYLRCGVCQATFLDPAQRLSIEAEHEQYRLHRNDPGSAVYRRFLSKLVVPLLERLPPEAKGLDYGCGPARARCYMRYGGCRTDTRRPNFGSPPT